MNDPFEPFLRWRAGGKQPTQLSREDLFREGYMQALRDVGHRYRAEPTRPHRYEVQASGGSTWCRVCGQAKAHVLHQQ